MANTTITALPPAISLDGTESIEIVQNGTSKKTTSLLLSSLNPTTIQIANNTLLANISGATASPSSTTLTQFLDSVITNTQGSLIYRSGSAWTSIAPGSSGQVLTTGGAGANPTWSTNGVGTVTSITAGTNLSASPSNPITDSGTINVVANPNFATSVTSPIIYGGTGTGSTLTLVSTSGGGVTDSINFAVGTNGATNAFTIDTTGSLNANLSNGQRFNADFSNATISNRFAFKTSTLNASTGIYALPNGSSTAASWQATNNSDPTNASKVLIATNGSTDVQLVSGINGSGTYLPLAFYNNGLGRFVIGTAGQFGIGPTATVSYGTSGQTFISGGNAAAPSWGVLGVSGGGTGQSSNWTQWGAIYASTTGALASTATGTTGQPLLANSTSGPAFGNLALGTANTNVSGTLTVTNGGTGAATFTANGVLYGNTTSAIQVTAQGAANSILTANAGAPSFSASPTIGTSVTTPLVIGGMAAGSKLTLTSTSNATASGDQVLINVGNNGATTAATFASTAAFLQMGAGTSAIAPLKFTSGTNLGTATAGSVEYNGTTALVTPLGAERGVAVTPQYYVNTATRTGPTAATTFVNILPASPSLTASTRYAFEIYFAITKTSANACTGAIGFSITGTAPAAMSYQIVSTTGATQPTVASASYMSNYITTGFGTAVVATAASAASANTYHTVKITGTIDTGAGAITAFAPQFQYSTGAPTASTFQVGAYMFIYPLSATGAVTSVGTWA